MKKTEITLLACKFWSGLDSKYTRAKPGTGKGGLIKGVATQ